MAKGAALCGQQAATQAVLHEPPPPPYVAETKAMFSQAIDVAEGHPQLRNLIWEYAIGPRVLRLTRLLIGTLSPFLF